MENTKVNSLISQYKDFVPEEQILMLKNALVKADDSSYDNLIAVSLKNKTTTLLLSIFLGGLGIDRFYIGDTGVGVCKLLFGWLTLGIWPFVDIFCCYKKTKEKNIQKLLLLIN